MYRTENPYWFIVIRRPDWNFVNFRSRRDGNVFHYQSIDGCVREGSYTIPAQQHAITEVCQIVLRSRTKTVYESSRADAWERKASLRYPWTVQSRRGLRFISLHSEYPEKMRERERERAGERERGGEGIEQQAGGSWLSVILRPRFRITMDTVCVCVRRVTYLASYGVLRYRG